MLHGMRYPKYWGAIANHSGDAYFDFVYRCDWPKTLNELGKHRKKKRLAGAIDVLREEEGAARGIDDGRIRHFLNYVWKKEKLTDAEVHCLMNICMAATYDADPSVPNGFYVPFNLETGELIEKRWKEWQKHDPISLVGKYKEHLLTLKGIFIDCGWRDQYSIHYGSRILSKELALHDVPHTYEEFDDTHSGIDYRMDRSLPFLYEALKP